MKITFYLHILLIILQWIASLILLICAINLKNPYLLWGREYLTWAIIFLCLIHGLLMARYGKLFKRLTTSNFLLLLLLISTMTATVFNEARFQFDKYHVLHQEKELLQTLGQHIVIGYKNVEELSPLISTGAIGGVFITKRNIQGKTYQQIKALIANLQKIRADSGQTPLIIATDQEGGIVSRFSPPLTKLPPLATVIHGKKRPKSLIEATKYGEIHGKELAAIGINVNFSPVIDLRNNNESNPLDFHSLINKRAISHDKNIVAEIGLAYSLGLEKYGVIPTLKHFPGMGRVVEDTHHFGAEISTPIKQLEQTDWIPFKYILKRSQSFMMLGHVVLSSLDAEHPVSYSKKVIQTILRQQWKYEGVLITDDLTMNSIYSGQHGLCESSRLALNAGVDLLLISYDYQKYYEVMSCLSNAYTEQTLDTNRLLKSKLRIEDITDTIP